MLAAHPLSLHLIVALPHTGSGGVTTAEIGGSFSYQLFCISTARMHNIAFPGGADLLVAPGCRRCRHPQCHGPRQARMTPSQPQISIRQLCPGLTISDSQQTLRATADPAFESSLCFTYNIGADANLCNRTAAGFSHPLVMHTQAYPHTHTSQTLLPASENERGSKSQNRIRL